MNLNIPCVILKDERNKSSKEIIWQYVQIFIAEVLGTGCLMFFGCGAQAPGFYHHSIMGGGLLFGMVVGAIVQVFAVISYGHINPIVTICFWIFGVISLPMALNYIVAQFVGALLGYSLLVAISMNWVLDIGLPFGNKFCCTLIHPDMETWKGAIWEYIMSAFLVLTVCAALDPRNATRQDSMTVKFAIMIFVLAYIGGPYTGASMNPARSFAPALIMNKWDNIWVYMVMPPLASIISSFFYYVMFMPKTQVGEE